MRIEFIPIASPKIVSVVAQKVVNIFYISTLYIPAYLANTLSWLRDWDPSDDCRLLVLYNNN